MPDYDPRPLLLLDVDGVINDGLAMRGASRSWPEQRFPITGGLELVVPLHVPPLLEYLDLVCEIHWCTTWLDTANLVFPDLFGIGPYPVIGTEAAVARGWGWKARSARRLVESALAAGRRVYWIEDFEGETPGDLMPPGVTYVDTAADGAYVLLPHHLPDDLRPRRLPGGR